MERCGQMLNIAPVTFDVALQFYEGEILWVQSHET
jgi:hypothetical protein